MLQVTTTAATRAAEEARSGAWLAELESGRPLRALAPGMEQGVYGGWALPEQATDNAGSISLADSRGTQQAAEASGSTASHGQPAAAQEPAPAVDLTNLFAGVWMGDDEDSAWSEACEDAAAPEAGMHSAVWQHCLPWCMPWQESLSAARFTMGGNRYSRLF